MANHADFWQKEGCSNGNDFCFAYWAVRRFGQNLSLHPHIHCIVPGGGVDGTGNWQSIRSDGKFLFSVKALSKVFRAKYVGILSQKIELDKELRESLFKKDWVVYAKRPFGSPKSVVEYLGRYTPNVAISNHRLKSIDEERVTFSYKDYRSQGEKKVMSLTHQEFIRRFTQHILPKRYVRIRHYGLLSSTWKREKFKRIQANFNIKPAKKQVYQTLNRKCRCCKTGNLVMIAVFDQRSPPCAGHPIFIWAIAKMKATIRVNLWVRELICL